MTSKQYEYLVYNSALIHILSALGVFAAKAQQEDISNYNDWMIQNQRDYMESMRSQF